MPPMARIETCGVLKRLNRESAAGHTPSRLKVNASRVALSIAVLIEVSVAIMPAIAIIGTPTRGIKCRTASVSAVSEPANSRQGTVPSVTVPTRT